MLTAQEYYELSVAHRNVHKCGGMPFENGDFLSKIAQATGATRILEIGSAIGYSAFCFARANKMLKVDTIDMHKEHLDLAFQYWKECEVEGQIDAIQGKSGEVVIQLLNNHETYDLIFFDAFSPNPDEVSAYINLLTNDALLITTNLELPSEINRVDEYLKLLNESNLETRVHGDIAFSSTNSERLQLCESLWF